MMKKQHRILGRLAAMPSALVLPGVPDSYFRLRPWQGVAALCVLGLALWAAYGAGVPTKHITEEAMLVEVQAPPPPEIKPPPSPSPQEEPPPPPQEVSADPDQSPNPSMTDHNIEAQFGIPDEGLGEVGDMAVATGNTLMKAADTLVKAAPPQLALAFNPQDVRSAYLTGLRKMLEARKKYPALARRLKQQGSVRVRFAILSDGRIDAVVLAQGSRFDALDQGALQAVQSLVYYKPIPTELQMDRWEVEIPISYRLD
jgi:periplasmic protein TonB